MSQYAKNIRKFTYVQLLGLHIGLALLVYLIRPSSVIYLLGSFAIFMIYILAKGNRNNEVLYIQSLTNRS